MHFSGLGQDGISIADTLDILQSKPLHCVIHVIVLLTNCKLRYLHIEKFNFSHNSSEVTMTQPVLCLFFKAVLCRPS